MTTQLLGMKRGLQDLVGLHEALPPTTCSGAAAHLSGDVDGEVFLAKRARFFSEKCAQSARAAGVPPREQENAFPKPVPVGMDEIERVVASLHSSSPSKIQSASLSACAEKKYSFEDLTSIVSKVVLQRETELRCEYDQILMTKLNEQFTSFTRFNQDHISRMVSNNHFSYVA